MNKIITSLLFLLISDFVFGQYTLSTPDGKLAELKADGTWKFKDITKDSAVYTSKKKYYHFTYNANNWIKQDKETALWDTEFKSKNGVISATAKEFDKFFTREKVEELLKSEYMNIGTIKRFDISERTLNNSPVTYYTFKMNVLGDVHTYSGIVLSNENGSFQLSVGGQDALYNLNKESIEDLLFSVHKN